MAGLPTPIQCRRCVNNPLVVTTIADNIDPDNDGSKYAYGENVGWINFGQPQGPGVIVTSSRLTGYAWGENIGWINLAPTGGGVVNDGTGNLSGYAWGENVGWINFAPTGSGVSIDTEGVFRGRAWGENIGWITFSSDGPVAFSVKTFWTEHPDTTPYPFTLADQQGVPLNSVITSGTGTVSGINTAAPISISGCTNSACEYSVNAGGWISAAGTVNNGDAVQVRQTSSGNFSTTTDLTLNIGGVTDTFSVTTLAADTTPDAFSFLDQTNVSLSTVVESNAITVSGINTVAPVSITGGEYRIGIGAWTSAPGTVNNGDTVTVRQTSSGNYFITIDAALTIGGVSDAFSVTTIAENMDPDNDGSKYAYGENVGWINFGQPQGPGVVVTSSGLTGYAWGENIGWINLAPAGSGVVNDGAGNLSGYAWGENVGWINFAPTGSGVSIDAEGVFLGRAWGENIGWITFSSEGTVAFRVKTSWTAPPDATPDPFTFADQTDVAPNTVVESNVITVSGINTGAPISIADGEYSINGGTYTAAVGTVNNGNTVRVRQTSSSAYSTTTNATLTIGDVSDTFSVTTIPNTPDTIGMAVVNAGDNRIGYGSWDSEGTFAGFSPIGGASSEAPAMAVFMDREYMAAKGETTNNIFLRYQDSTGAWTSWGALSGATSKSPALAVFNNRLYMAVKRAANNNIYLRSTDTSGTWDTSWTQISGATSEAPALTAFNNRLYLFVKGAANNKVYYRSMDISGTWDGWAVLSGGTTKPIGLSAFNGELYVFVKGAANNNIYYRSMDTSETWRSWIVLSGKTTEAPSVTVLGDKLYVAVKGAADNNAYIRSMDLSGNWDSSWTAVPANTNKTPVLSTFYYIP
jgi:hypothetical protein